jgi:hypothetical protein
VRPVEAAGVEKSPNRPHVLIGSRAIGWTNICELHVREATHRGSSSATYALVKRIDPDCGGPFDPALLDGVGK